MPILPTVMPDEFVLGYWGRVHILNLLDTPNQTVKALIDYFALPPSRIQRLEALALAAKTDVQNLVQKHTLIPAHGAISQHFIGATHGTPASPDVIKQSWKLLQKSGAYFCPECAVAQQAQWGFSYWMRKHQLLGVDWCLEHRTHLLPCNVDAFMNSTPNLREITKPSNLIEPERTYWPILERYSQIMIAYLSRTIRVGVQDVARRLRPIAAARKLGTRGILNAQHLSDIAVEQLPSWWLDEMFPSINSKQANAPFLPLDNTVLSGFAMAHAYALAMAILYESSEEALASLPQ
jgi:hypothetical protein